MPRRPNSGRRVDPATINIMSTPVARSYLEDDVDPLKSPSRARGAHDGTGQGTAEDYDATSSPLGPPRSAAAAAPLTPLSFKRKSTARHSSSGAAVRDKAAHLIGGILRTGSSGQPDSTSPAFRRTDAPTHIALPKNAIRHKPSFSEFSQAIASDEEDEEDEGETTAGESPRQRRGSAFRRGDATDRDRQRRLSAGKRVSSKGLGLGNRSRRSTGTGAFGSPSKEPGLVSPLWGNHPYGDGGDDDRPSDGTVLADGALLEVTPLPKMPIFVLSICMLGEFLSASVCSPFLFL